MKNKYLIYTLCFIVGFTLSFTSKHVLPKSESEVNYYNYADSLDLIEIINCHDLTIEELESRNGKLIIERVIGIVDDATEGKGHVINDADYYISYRSVKGISNGDVVCTFFVYNPDNNYYDDIMMRFDYIIEQKGD